MYSNVLADGMPPFVSKLLIGWAIVIKFVIFGCH